MPIVDANILIRAVMGVRALSLIDQYTSQVRLLAPETAFEEAKRHLRNIVRKSAEDLQSALNSLENLRSPVEAVEESRYVSQATEAKLGLARRDPDDWPVLTTPAPPTERRSPPSSSRAESSW